MNCFVSAIGTAFFFSVLLATVAKIYSEQMDSVLYALLVDEGLLE